jgi:hypothetical protein
MRLGETGRNEKAFTTEDTESTEEARSWHRFPEWSVVATIPPLRPNRRRPAFGLDDRQRKRSGFRWVGSSGKLKN